jgi:hypothetical protein
MQFSSFVEIVLPTDDDKGPARFAKLLEALGMVGGQVESARKMAKTNECIGGIAEWPEHLKRMALENAMTDFVQKETMEKNKRALCEMETHFARLLRATERTVEAADFDDEETGHFCARKDTCRKITRALERLALIPDISIEVAVKALDLLCKFRENIYVVHEPSLEESFLEGSSPIEDICANHAEAGSLGRWFFKSLTCFNFNADTGRVWRSLCTQLDHMITAIKRIDARDAEAIRGGQIAIEKIMEKKGEALPINVFDRLFETYIDASARAMSASSVTKEVKAEIRDKVQEYIKEDMKGLIEIFEENGYTIRRRMYTFCREVRMDTSWFPDDVVDSDEEAERAAKKQKK